MVDRGLNGIQVHEPSGLCRLWMRFIGGGTYLAADNIATVEDAKAIRAATILEIGSPPSAVGIARIGPLTWRAQVRHRKTTYCLGDFPTEQGAAACRLAFDAWSEAQPDGAIHQALQDHNRRKRNSHHE